MRLYLYLARRDRSAVNVVSVFETPKPIEAARLTAAGRLGLPTEEAESLQALFQKNRMDWEPWIETADDYPELKKKLEKRGYKNVPGSCKPMHSSSSYTDPYAISSRFEKQRTMLRRATP